MIRLKTWFYALCYALARLEGFFGVKRGPVVLMYHSVGTDGGKLTVDPEAFRAQMEFLRAKRNVVSMEDVIAYLDGKELPRDSVAVTIDDGYLDTYTQAFPILKEFRIPFTLFLTTDLRPLPALSNLPRPSWDQLREMHAIGLMTPGLHGHQHIHIDTIAGNVDLLDKELKDSLRMIGKELGEEPHVYAYAFGKRDRRLSAYLQTIDIWAGFGITDGTVSRASNPHGQRRVQVDQTTTMRLLAYRTTAAVDYAFRILRLLRR